MGSSPDYRGRDAHLGTFPVGDGQAGVVLDGVSVSLANNGGNVMMPRPVGCFTKGRLCIGCPIVVALPLVLIAALRSNANRFENGQRKRLSSWRPSS